MRAQWKNWASSPRALLTITVVAAVMAYLGPLINYDLWWHLKAAQGIVRDLALPHADSFSFTAAGRPWTYHSWLSGLALLGVWNLGGVAGLIVFRAAMMAAALTIAWFAARDRGVGPGLASVLVLAACLQLHLRALARPYLFSFVFFMVFVLILQRARGPRAQAEESGAPGVRDFLWGHAGHLVLLPVLNLVWVNMHAGFISGWLVLGAFGVGELVRIGAEAGGRRYFELVLRDAEGARFRAMLAAGVLCVLASLVTPYGAGILLYPFRLASEVKLVAEIQEWQPTPLMGRFAVFWGVLVVGMLAMARSCVLLALRRRLRPEIGGMVADVLLFVGFGFLAVHAVRHMAWCLLLAPAIVGYHLNIARLAVGDKVDARPLYAYAALVLAFVVGPWRIIEDGPPRWEVSDWHIPAKACDWMGERGVLYRPCNSYEWGGYLIWRFWPELRVFIDGRCLVYQDDIIGQTLQVERGREGWRDVLDRWDIEMLVIRYRSRECSQLFLDSGYTCVYWDDIAVVALREDVLRSRPDLADLSLSNPATFKLVLEEQPVEPILRQVEEKIAVDPACWTARIQRARCLMKLAATDGVPPERRSQLLGDAFGSAREAVELRENEYTWQAVADVAEAMGEEDAARKAAKKAASFK